MSATSDAGEGAPRLCAPSALAACTLLGFLCCLALPGLAQAAERLFVLEGHGYGHGVGMGQYGAEGLAAHGRDYRGVLAHYYPGTAIARVPPFAHVRVLLVSSQGSVLVGSVTSVRLVDAFGHWARLPPGRYAIDRRFLFRVGDRFVSPRSPVRLIPTVAPLTLNGEPYRGAFVVRAEAAGVSVVNDLEVDDYVRGVIAWEMPASWHLEALRAQAVAARSYALASLTPSRSFDVYPDQRSQMYGGLRAERAATDHAVLTTLRQVLVWNGQVASTYFSSSSGGRTAAASDVWPSGRRLPYLVSAPDPYDSRSPQHHWGPYLLSASTLAARLGVPEVVDARTLSDPRSGRVRFLEIRERAGTARFSGAEAARALGLRSTWFTIRNSQTNRSTRTARHTLVVPSHSRRTGTPSSVVASTPPPQAPPPSNLLIIVVTTSAAACVMLLFRDNRRAASTVRACVGVSAVVAITAGALTVALERSKPATKQAIQQPRSATGSQIPPDRPANRTSTRNLPEGTAPNLPRTPGVTSPTNDLVWHNTVETKPPAAGQAKARPSTSSGSLQTSGWALARVSAPRPPAPLEISGIELHSLSATSAAITWRTNLPAITQGASALGLTPRLWSTPTPAGFEHETVFTGMAGATAYRVWLLAQDEFGQTANKQLLIATQPPDTTTDVRTSGDTILVNEQPLFPIILWSICTSELGSKLRAGINTFMGNSCESDGELVQALDGQALAVVDRTDPDVNASGVLGWYYPDEWDAALPGSVSREQLQANPVDAAEGRISFLTLTDHFYSRANPLPQGKGMYPTLLSIPDVVGFDLYPLQTWCRAAFADVFDAQAELHAASGGKPTFQWIEAAPMEHPCNTVAALNPTAATVRAESWLAIAGGADGIGYFPNSWSAEIDDTIAQTNWQIRELAPALLAPDAEASTTTEGIRVSARALNGALYIIAVNTTNATTEAALRIPSLGDRTAEAVGENRSLTADRDILQDRFAPLDVHIYVVPPAPWTAASFTSESEAEALPASPSQEELDPSSAHSSTTEPERTGFDLVVGY